MEIDVVSGFSDPSYNICASTIWTVIGAKCPGRGGLRTCTVIFHIAPHLAFGHVPLYKISPATL